MHARGPIKGGGVRMMEVTPGCSIRRLWSCYIEVTGGSLAQVSTKKAGMRPDAAATHRLYACRHR